MTKKSVAELTVYLLDQSVEMQSATERPGVLIFPGGAYQTCSDREAEPIATAFLAEGYQAFVLRYTVGTGTDFSQALNDAQEALKLIKDHSKQWHLLADKIVACGFSAGGHLAAMLATTGELRPNALVLGYPCVLAEMGETLNYPIPSVEQAVDQKTPPTFIFASRDDEIVPIKNSLALVHALERAQVAFELHIYAHGRHGLSLAKPMTANGLRYYVNPRVATWFQQTISWLNQLWQPFPAENDYQLIPNGTVLDQPLGYLWQISSNQSELLHFLPFMADKNQRTKVANVSLNIMAAYAKELLPAETLSKLKEKLIQDN
ncbi:xylan esterase [Liquorilactobacillus nagelii DSM 13675]|nr:xylan esterase [Liquorilactobacillus nagelii DSM 13675]